MSANYKQLHSAFVFVCLFISSPTSILVQSDIFCSHAAAAMVQAASPCLSFHQEQGGSILTSLPVLKPWLRVTRSVTEPLPVSLLPDKQSVHGHFTAQGKSNMHVQIVGGGQSCAVSVLIRKGLPGNPSQNLLVVTDPKRLIVNRRRQCKLLSMRAASKVPVNPPTSRTADTETLSSQRRQTNVTKRDNAFKLFDFVSDFSVKPRAKSLR